LLRIVGGGMTAPMPQIPPLVDKRIIRPAETALALDLLSEFDLLRLKTIARLYARGLPPDVAWDDLLQEALTRVLVGSRRQPEGVAVVAFVAGIMRSLKSEHWRRALQGSGRRNSVRIDRASGESREVALTDPAPGPERSLSARQELTAIERLFADDDVALKIVAGLIEGLSAEQIRTASRISKTDYDSARRRMRRTLLREGLTCEPNQ
jgi:DNA-directed RNA polymerase specialized sigma24 family protein